MKTNEIKVKLPSLDKENFEEFRNHVINNCKYKLIENYSINDYKSDFYIPELNLALKFY